MSSAAALQAPAAVAAPGAVALEVEDLHTQFGPLSAPIAAVRGVSLRLERGETMVLLGESGSGKSVMARSVLRLYGRNARITGRIQLGDLDLAAADERTMQSIRGERIALVPQDPNGALDPLRTIGSQIVEVLRQHGAVASKRAGQARAVELLRLVGIPDARRIARAYPHQLSGGMRQRVVIAIGVSCEPEVLIADEPTTALDVTVQAQILELFGSLQATMQMALLLVTHDVGVAREVGDRVSVMYAGRIVEAGPATQVLDSPAHPYTAALLGAVPRPGVARGTLARIPGRAVLAGETFVGCPFAPRCERAVSASRHDEPELLPIGRGRLAACHNPILVEQAS